MDRPLLEPPKWFEYAPRSSRRHAWMPACSSGATTRRARARRGDEYGVPPEIIVAIIGVETAYGRNIGRYRVLDALATLAFDYPRRAPTFSAAS